MANSASAIAKTGLALLREIVSASRRARAEDIAHTPRPSADGFVLDVGSGQAAHPRADVIVDKYVADDFERGSALQIDKPLVVADGHALPFSDRAFGYVIASHVLEHATDPVAFASELARVGRAGFVQVPSREAELTFGWPFHPWLIDRGGGGILHFHPRGDERAPLGTLFHRAFADSELFALWFRSRRSQWHHSVHWQNRIDVNVHGASAAPRTAELDIEKTVMALRAGPASGPTGELSATLACPVDRGALREGEAHLSCATCDRAFPVVATVPLLLAEAAR